MKRYKYLRLFPYYNPFVSPDCAFVTVTTADSDTVNRMVPQIEALLGKTFEVEGRGYDHLFKKLRNRDAEVGHWMIQWLCSEGWEPFAVHGFSQGKFPGRDPVTYEVIHFRKEIQ